MSSQRRKINKGMSMNREKKRESERGWKRKREEQGWVREGRNLRTEFRDAATFNS